MVMWLQKTKEKGETYRLNRSWIAGAEHSHIGTSVLARY